MFARILIVALVGFTRLLPAQTEIVTTDIKHFYTAFDKVHQTPDSSKQLQIIQTEYIDKGTPGLQLFLRLSNCTAEKWRFYMLYHKDYLNQIRPSLEAIAAQIPAITQKLADIKAVYPGFKDGTVYFLIGTGIIGGSADQATQSLLLFGEVLVKKQPDWAVPLVLHEFLHLQQKNGNGQLLTQTIKEGVAEFLSEIFYGKSLAANGFAPHIAFGRRHEQAVWKAFKNDMLTLNQGYLGWLYGIKKIGRQEKSDLGYFVGYGICKAYYSRAHDKNQAIRDLLNLDLSIDEKVRNFVLQSGYVNAKDAAALQKAPFTDKKPATGSGKTQPYGFAEKGGVVRFSYAIPQDFLNRFKVPIVYVSVAGSFNGWNPGAAGFRMARKGNNKFVLDVPKTALGAHNAFKFVLNGDNWMPVPANASNVDQDGNLTVDLK